MNNKINVIKFCILVAVSSIVFYTCKEEPTKPPVIPPTTKPTIKIEVQYADFTEILLKVMVSDTSSWKQIAIKRNGELIHFNNFLNRDTVIVDNGLQSNTNYLYQALLIDKSKPIDSSIVNAKTREYGSHNWRFEIDTLGENLSAGHDIVSFSKTDAWATGEFRIYDYSTPNWDFKTYCLAHWDGQKWKLMGLRDSDNLPQIGLSIFGLSPNDIWMIARRIWHFDGTKWNEIPLSAGTLNGAVNRIYGKSSSDFYSVGDGGSVSHWDGHKVLNLSTPTSINLYDIYGDENIIYSAGISSDLTSSVILKIEDMKVNKVDSLYWNYSGLSQVVSVWLKKKDSVIAYAGNHNRIYYRGKELIAPSPVDGMFCTHVRGTGIQNIWFVGSSANLVHFDGFSWKGYTDFNIPNYRTLSSVVVTDDYFFAIGISDFNDGTTRGFVVRGYKY